MADQANERDQRVTPLELFFDLVFVFAFTQVTSFLGEHPTGAGLLRALLLLAMLWWAWSGYAWLTNALDPEEGGIRLAVLAAVGAMLIVSLTAPGAFGKNGVLFGVVYFFVRAVQLVLNVVAARGNPDALRAVMRIVPGAILGAGLLIVAGFFDGTTQLVLWGIAVAATYLGALLAHMHGWHVSPEHFVERFGLIIIIALGESIVAIGVGAAGVPLDAGVIIAALLGITVTACLWWSYFDWAIYVGHARLAEATGAKRAALARDLYSYLHLPMVGGIVLFAFGLKATIGHGDASLETVPAFGLVGGIALYLLAHVALRLRIRGGWGRGRPIATLVLFGLFPVATRVPAVVALAIVAAVCVVMILYEVLRHRESRAWIRSRRGAFTMEEAAQVVEPRRRERRRQEGK